MEPHLVLAALNHYILTSDMIFFIQQLNTRLQNDLPLLQRFNKQFILKGLLITLEFNYFT